MKVGDYVRTDRGQIGKITYFEGDMVRVDCDKFITYKSNHNEITKISPNIIDLIEVGDYVNGYLVTTGNQGVGSIYIAEIDGLGLKKKLYEKDIKSIVTKEAFENMEYRIGDIK